MCSKLLVLCFTIAVTSAIAEEMLLNRIKRQKFPFLKNDNPPSFGSRFKNWNSFSTPARDQPKFDINGGGSIRSGLDVNLKGNVPLFQSSDNSKKLNAFGFYNQTIGGPNGSKPPIHGWGLLYNQNFNSGNKLNVRSEFNKNGTNPISLGASAFYDHRLRNGDNLGLGAQISHNSNKLGLGVQLGYTHPIRNGDKIQPSVGVSIGPGNGPSRFFRLNYILSGNKKRG